MKLAGITRVRNESAIIKDALDHAAEFCDAGIYVYDDCSTDGTTPICTTHKAVKACIRGDKWDPTPEGRQRMEGYGRQVPYDMAVAAGADYVYCFDADEFAELVYLPEPVTQDAYSLRLFDFYITTDDVYSAVCGPPLGRSRVRPYIEREWMGPEYRDIPMVFKAVPGRRWGDRIPDHERPALPIGYVKHYGKAISVEEWEKTCLYYADIRWNLPRFEHLRKRWLDRRGKAVHTESDFGRPLIRWEDRKDESKIVKI